MRYFKKRLQTTWANFKSDSLFRNAVYLILSTGVMAFFGFFFWVITAHLYSTAAIGVATAAIAVTVLISSLSQLGNNTALVRHLPKSKNSNELINSSITIVGLATLLITGIYLIGIERFSPKLVFLRHDPLTIIAFMVFMTMVSINSLTDSVFVARRESQYNFIVYSVFGFLKVILPPFLIALGAFGIFLSYTTSVVVGLILSFYFMYKRYGYRLRLFVSRSLVRQVGGYSISNYVANFLASAPLQVMPILIVNGLGADQAAYYYIASMIANLLYIIPNAVGQSLLAEGSHNEAEMLASAKAAAILTAKLLVPAILVIIAASKLLLAIFGQPYAAHAATILQLLALSGVFMAITQIGISILRVQKRIAVMIAINAVYAVASLVLVHFALGHGLTAVGISLIASQGLLALLYVMVILMKKPAIRNKVA